MLLFINDTFQVIRNKVIVNAIPTKFIVDLGYNFIGCTTDGLLYTHTIEGIVYHQTKCTVTTIFPLNNSKVGLLFTDGKYYVLPNNIFTTECNLASILDSTNYIPQIQYAFNFVGNAVTIDNNNQWKCNNMFICGDLFNIKDAKYIRDGVITTYSGTLYLIHKNVEIGELPGYQWELVKINCDLVDAMMVRQYDLIIGLNKDGHVYNINLHTMKCKMIKHGLFNYIKVVKLIKIGDKRVCFQSSNGDIFSIDDKYNIGSLHKFNSFFTV